MARSGRESGSLRSPCTKNSSNSRSLPSTRFFFSSGDMRYPLWMLREVEGYTTALLAEIEELEGQLFDNSFNATTIARELDSGAKLWVVEGPTCLEGYMLLRTEGGVTDILRLGVRPLLQGRGVGSSLLGEAKSSFGRLMLCVRKTNTRAIQLYQRQGFVITGDLGVSWVMELHRLLNERRAAVEAPRDLLAVR